MSDRNQDSDAQHDTSNENTDKDKPERGSNKTEISNILAHIKKLESENNNLSSKLQEAMTKNEKLSSKTRDGMKSALDTLLKKWMDAVETKDEQVKVDFKSGLEKLVQNSAEDNGVWQMMVSASALHERKEHELEKLRLENGDLRKRVDGQFAAPEDRLAGRKRGAETELDRSSVPASDTDKGFGFEWDDFAKLVGDSF